MDSHKLESCYSLVKGICNQLKLGQLCPFYTVHCPNAIL